MISKTHTADWIALLIAAAGLLASGLIAERVYERIPHIEDEFALLWQAQVMADGEISLPSPDYERSFLVPFVVDFEGRRFGKYPPGWPAALSLGARLDAAGWVNPLLSAVVLWFVYRLARKLLSPGLSLLAEVLVLGSPMFLMLSGNLMPHMFSLLLTLVFILAWTDLFLRKSEEPVVPVWLLVCVAGGSIGLLFLTRPLTAVAIALPFAIHGLILFASRIRKQSGAMLLIGLVGGLIGSLLLLWQWVLTCDPLTNPYTLWWSYDRIGFGPSIGVTESGHTLSWAYYNTRFSLRAGLHDLFGWPYLSWILLPFGLFAMFKRRLTWLFSAVFVSLIIAYSFYWIGSWLFGPRYYFEALPGLAILSAGGFGWLGGWLVDYRGSVRVRRQLSIIILAVFLLGNIIFYLPLRVGGMKGLYQIDRQSSVRFIVEKPERTLIIIRASKWFQYARYLYQVEPFNDNPMLIAWSRGQEIDEALMRSYKGRNSYYYDVETGRLQSLPKFGVR
jgi:hypothetical protein